MARNLVIGYGNPLRGDDGIGVRAAERLAEAVEADSDGEVEVVTRHQLALELAPLVAAAERLILLDACVGGEPGAVNEQVLTPATTDVGALSHHLDPRGLLAAAQILYGRAPTAILLTVAGASFDYGETLSPPVAAALPQLVARVKQLLLRSNARRQVA
ncbi:MAG: hydrogenase maturation protease [Anaerolineae bacterium]|nr:hydrogenase maturation protease [Anaerolineae bacterium]